MERSFFIVRDRLGENIKLPERASKFSAGYDFYSPSKVVVPSHGRAKVLTGVKVSMGEGEVLLLFIRSSLAIKRGLLLSNCVGVIDADYFENVQNDGEIVAELINTTDKDVVIEENDRFMQGIFVKYLTVNGDNIDKIRCGGVGSTGL